MGDKGQHYDSRVGKTVIFKDGQIFANLNDGTQLKAIEDSDWEIVKDNSLWEGKIKILCRVDGNNKPRDWFVPEMQKTLLTMTDARQKQIKQETLQEVTDTVEFLAKANEAIQKANVKKEEKEQGE